MFSERMYSNVKSIMKIILIFAYTLQFNLSFNGIYYNRVLYYLIVFFSVIPFLFDVKDIIKNKKFNILHVIFIIFTLVATLSCVINIKYFDKETLGQIIELYIIFTCFFYTNQNIFELEKEIQLIFKMFIFISLFMSALTVISYVFNIEILLPNGILVSCPDHNYVTGMWRHHNHAAINALLSIVLSLYYIFSKNKFSWLYYFNLIFQTLIITWSSSRSTIIACLVLFAVLLLFRRNKKLIVILCVVLTTIVLGRVITDIHTDEPARDYGEIWDNSSVDINDNQELSYKDTQIYKFINVASSGRLDIWSECIEITVNDKLLLGNGLKNMTQRACDYYGNNGILCSLRLLNGHDIFINIFTNTGLIGLLVFMYLIIKELLLIFKNRLLIRDDELLFACFLVCLVSFTCVLLEQGIFMPLYSHCLIFWLCLSFINYKLYSYKSK